MHPIPDPAETPLRRQYVLREKSATSGYCSRATVDQRGPQVPLGDLVPGQRQGVLPRHAGGLERGGVEQDGRVLPKEQFPVTSLRIRDDTILHEGGPHQLLKVRFRLHPNQQPKAMDMESEGYHGDLYHAIYALEGDTLTICRPDDATRPTKFASSPGSNVLLYKAKRIIQPASP